MMNCKDLGLSSNENSENKIKRYVISSFQIVDIVNEKITWKLTWRKIYLKVLSE